MMRLGVIGLNRWRGMGIALGVAGVGDALYLTAESLYPRIPLYCPSAGFVNCSSLTSGETRGPDFSRHIIPICDEA